MGTTHTLSSTVPSGPSSPSKTSRGWATEKSFSRLARVCQRAVHTLEHSKTREKFETLKVQRDSLAKFRRILRWQS
jgi:hypothetical protein